MFERLMDFVLHPHHAYATAYLDDLVMHSVNWQEHLFHVRKVLADLQWARLMAYPQKCHVGLTEAQYLGYSIGRGLLKPQEKKVEAVRFDPWPETKRQV